MGILLAITVIIAAVLGAWRWSDHRTDAKVWAKLAAHQPADPGTFDHSMIHGLPEPAQRYFLYTISPGTPLYTVAIITMEGEFSLGNKAKPNYMPMRAKQILAAPHGFVWVMNSGSGLMRVSGSDSAVEGHSWSRFWLLGIAPVARAGGNADLARSAFGRYIAEAVFWTPAALLPGEDVHWSPIDESTARVTVTRWGLEQAVDLSVDADGRPTRVVFQRWSNANMAKEFKLQPFGGYLSEFKKFDGFRLPTKIEAGNFFETDEYFPFFNVTVTSVQLPTTQ